MALLCRGHLGIGKTTALKAGSTFGDAAVIVLGLMRISWKIRWNQERARYALKEVSPLTRFALGYLRKTIRQRSQISESDFQDLIAEHILGKPFQAEEKAYFSRVRKEKEISRWGFVLSFFRLPLKLEKTIYPHSTLDALHAARLDLIQHHLPPAAEVLDLGGACDYQEEGALLAMGYRHRPGRILIVDLPVNERHYTEPKVSPEQLKTGDGTQVDYLYTSMTDLSQVQSATFQMVWSGQSIEHVTEQDADRMLADVYRVLKPEGYFCLDTPNRKVTRLMSEQLIHPEHKIEYLPEQLAAKLTRHGFVIEKILAVTPLPISQRLGRLSKVEILAEARVAENYDCGLSFYIQCRKPLNSKTA